MLCIIIIIIINIVEVKWTRNWAGSWLRHWCARGGWGGGEKGVRLVPPNCQGDRFRSRLLLWRPTSWGDLPIGTLAINNSICELINRRAQSFRLENITFKILFIFILVHFENIKAEKRFCLHPSLSSAVLFSSPYDHPPPRLPNNLSLPLPRLPSNFSSICSFHLPCDSCHLKVVL